MRSTVHPTAPNAVNSTVEGFRMAMKSAAEREIELSKVVQGPNSASIIIPLKNGMPYFPKVCAALQQQAYDAPFEVICVDSGSTDGSDRLAEESGFRLERISSEDFGHGRTRNYAASLSQAEYLVFLTHDAIPADPHWLSALLMPMRTDNRIGGVFGRHIAHDDADPFIAWELSEHFKGLRNFPVVEITDRVAYDADQGLQQIYHYYSDNSSAMPRRIWQEFPYPDVQFAEDQIWAKIIVEAVYRKAFAPDSVVKHSHSFGPVETLRRSYDESRAFRILFGYTLSSSLWAVVRSSGYLVLRDMGLAWKNGWWRSHPRKTLSRILEAFAKPMGHYLGARASLPARLADRLSRDTWIRNL